MGFLRKYWARRLVEEHRIGYIAALRSLDVQLDGRFAKFRKDEARVAVIELEDSFGLEEEVAKNAYLTSKGEGLDYFNAVLALKFKERFGAWQTLRIRDQKEVVPPSGIMVSKNGHDYLIGETFLCKKCENEHVAVKGLDARLEPYQDLWGAVHPTPNNWMKLEYTVLGNSSFSDTRSVIASFGEPLQTHKYGPIESLLASCDVDRYNRTPARGMGVVVL